MNNFTITARHAGLGEIVFVIPAKDKKDAFSKFKQVVYSVRQWTVVSNEGEETESETLDELPLDPVALERIKQKYGEGL